jgi:hypothetical protein
MLGLAALRWWWAGPAEQPSDVVAAVAPAVPRSVARPEAPEPADWASGTRDADAAKPGNAFPVRLPPVPAPPPRAPQAPAPQPLVAPAVAAPPVLAAAPPPPLQVIGSWLDDRGPSVFVASTYGVVHGRVGDVLMSEYRIVRISSQQVLMSHVRTQRETTLTVPPGAGPTLAAAK